MADLRYILLLLFLLPAISLSQTMPVEEEKVVYKGKIEMPAIGMGNAYNQAKSLLLNVINADQDSLKEVKGEGALASTASIRLPSRYHIIKHLNYKVKLQAKENEIIYEIEDIELKVQERGRKSKTISSAELIKGMQENGKVATQSEKQLNEVDMYLRKLIASMQAELRKVQERVFN